VLRVKREPLLLQNELISFVAEDHFLAIGRSVAPPGRSVAGTPDCGEPPRLQRDQDSIGEPRDLLAPIYVRFTEGFGTADLQAGKKLLDELNSPHRQ